MENILKKTIAVLSILALSLWSSPVLQADDDDVPVTDEDLAHFPDTAVENFDAAAEHALEAGARAARLTGHGIPTNASFHTLATFTFPIEGLTADAAGNLYTAERPGPSVPSIIYRIDLAGNKTAVGQIVGASGPAGLAFNTAGDLFIADGVGDKIFKVTPDVSVPTASVYVTGVPRVNGLAFDRFGNLWATDGNSLLGRVWKIPPTHTPGAPVGPEEFRIQPMRNSAALTGQTKPSGFPTGGVGRQFRGAPPATAANTAGGVELVCNGIAFDQTGKMYIADTARGAIWKVEFDDNGNVKSPMGCDSTYAPNTLCLSNILVAHPLLENVDGIALDNSVPTGNIWCAVNQRNAIVVVTSADLKVIEVFRNPRMGSGTNAGHRSGSTGTGLTNQQILEFPASPFLLGKTFAVAQTDTDARDNSPASDGEVKPAGPNRGKISVMDQELATPGMPLPVGSQS